MKRLIFILVLCIFMIQFGSALIGEAYIDTPNTASSIDNVNWRAQIIRIGAAGPLNATFNVSKLQIWFNATNATTVYVLIQNASGLTQTPNGENVSNGSLSGALIVPGVPRPYNITLSSAELYYGFNYSIIIYSDALGGNNNGPWTTIPGTYPQNNFTQSFDAGQTWMNVPGADMPFNLYTSDNTLGIGITLISPPQGTGTSNTNVNFTALLTPQNGNNTNATIYIWNSLGNLFNRTTNIVVGNENQQNYTSWDIDGFSQGTYTWNVLGCAVNATESICEWNTNFTLQIIPLSIINSTYNASVYETSYQKFELNFTTFPDILAGITWLHYNGSKYQATTNCDDQGSCLATSFLDINLAAADLENKSFFWEVTTYDGQSSATSNVSYSNQSVNRIYFEECNATHTTETLNFTVYDEENLTRIAPFIFQGTFRNWLGSGTQYRNKSIDNSTAIEELFCITPGNLTYHADADILYNNVLNSTAYNARNYYLKNATLNNIRNDIPLYLLKSSSATSFILHVVDQESRDVPNVYIYTQRYYPGNDSYATVQMVVTDNNGKSIGFFVTETVEYRFILVKDGQVVLITDKQKIFPEESPYTLTFRIGGGLGDIFSPYENLSNLVYSLTYNETLKLVTYTYIDTSGTTNYGRLLVNLENPSSGPTVICNSTSIQSSATINCNVTGFNGAFTAYGSISRSPEVIVAIIKFFTNLAKDIFGTAGLIMGFIIILAVALITVYNPVIQLIAVNITILGLVMMGLITFGAITIIGIMVISTIIIIILRA